MTIKRGPKRYCHFCATPLTEKVCGGRVRLFCPACETPIYENPLPAACTVVVDGLGRIFLVKRAAAPREGLWCLPGGFMELGETPEQTALRELSGGGISGRIEMLLGVTSQDVAYGSVLITGFLVRDYSSNLTAGDHASAAGFFPPDELPELAFSGHRRFIRIYHAAYAKIP